jgi:hypothetical protein
MRSRFLSDRLAIDGRSNSGKTADVHDSGDLVSSLETCGIEVPAAGFIDPEVFLKRSSLGEPGAMYDSVDTVERRHQFLGFGHITDHEFWSQRLKELQAARLPHQAADGKTSSVQGMHDMPSDKAARSGYQDFLHWL